MTLVALAALAPDLTRERMASTVIIWELERNAIHDPDHPLAFRIVSGRIVPVVGFLDTLMRPPYAKYAPTMNPELVRSHLYHVEICEKHCTLRLRYADYC